MVTEHLEMERKYDVDAERTVPDLTGVRPLDVASRHVKGLTLKRARRRVFDRQ